MNAIEKAILDILDTKQPSNCSKLVELVQKQVDATPNAIEQEIKLLHKKGLVELEEPVSQKISSISYF